jgi:hypothetical protein
MVEAVPTRDETSQRLKTLFTLALCAMLAASCVFGRPGGSSVTLPADLSTVTVAGQFSIPPLGRFPPGLGLRFGGISSLVATDDDGHEMIGISDDRDGTRAYRFRLSGIGDTFSVTPTDYISLERPRQPPYQLDPESLVIAPDGNFYVSSEGIGNVEPRVAPAIIEYGSRGEYVRQIAVPDRFVPNETGPLVKGVRSNFGFEALAISRDGSHLFTASETALAQDGDVTTVDHGALSRMIEYDRHGGTYVPAREFAYMIEPVFKPPFELGLAVNGLVDLIALGGSRLLAMERTYVEEAGNTGRGLNKIRIFQIDLAGATDVSSIESLKEAANLKPVAKSLVLDLSNVAGLSADLTPTLDNFEGMAFGPRLPDGRLSLVLVSDDNFNAKQRTWFVMLGIGQPVAARRIQ